MCQFFEKRGYPASVIQAAHHRAQQIDRQSTQVFFVPLNIFSLL